MKSRKSLHFVEKIITTMQLLIIVFFSTLQFIPCVRWCLPCLKDTVSGIFIQVDATILTLTIALIALITGFLSDSYMGISYSDYFLNVRPMVYKQVVIIILSLIYFGFGCIALWIGWDYLVAAILFCEILLIVMSVLSIYSIFKGKDNIKKEIERYSERMQLQGRS